MSKIHMQSDDSTWQIVKISDICEIRRGASPRPIDDPSYFSSSGRGWIRISDVSATYKWLNKAEQYLSEKGEKRSVSVEPDNLIMSICATIGKPVIVKIPASIHDGFVLFDKLHKDVDVNFLFYFLLQNQENILKNKQTGTQGNLNTKIVNAIEFRKPPIEEQQTIAAILDTLDEAIDAAEALLAKQEKMKQGLLQDLLTRGVDDNGQLRPHYHERRDLYQQTELGWIPKEWKIDYLGVVCARGGGNVQTGPFGSQLHAEDYKEQGVPIITVEHLNELSISHNNLPLVGKEDYQRLNKYDLRTGDLVFSRVGAIDRCSYVTEKEHGWLFSGRCLRVRSGNAINSKYLAFVLNSFRQRQWILNSAVGSTMACLNTTILSNVPITIPQSHEQNFVADALFDELIGENHLKSDLEKLQKIKTGLMQDLLTGRRRVTPELIRQVESLSPSAA